MTNSDKLTAVISARTDAIDALRDITPRMVSEVNAFIADCDRQIKRYSKLEREEIQTLKGLTL